MAREMGKGSVWDRWGLKYLTTSRGGVRGGGGGAECYWHVCLA